MITNQDREEYEEAFLRYFVHKVEWVGACWIWKGRTVGNPKYGRIEVMGVGRMLAHRFIYQFFTGPIIPGFIVHHNCKNTLCVNPIHLTMKSHADHASHHKMEWTKNRWLSIAKSLNDVSLSVRQRQILQCIESGMTTSEIATFTRMTVKGVEYHRAKLSSVN